MSAGPDDDGAEMMIMMMGWLSAMIKMECCVEMMMLGC